MCPRLPPGSRPLAGRATREKNTATPGGRQTATPRREEPFKARWQWRRSGDGAGHERQIVCVKPKIPTERDKERDRERQREREGKGGVILTARLCLRCDPSRNLLGEIHRAREAKRCKERDGEGEKQREEQTATLGMTTRRRGTSLPTRRGIRDPTTSQSEWVDLSPFVAVVLVVDVVDFNAHLAHSPSSSSYTSTHPAPSSNSLAKGRQHITCFLCRTQHARLQVNFPHLGQQ